MEVSPMRVSPMTELLRISFPHGGCSPTRALYPHDGHFPTAEAPHHGGFPDDRASPRCSSPRREGAPTPALPQHFLGQGSGPVKPWRSGGRP